MTDPGIVVTGIVGLAGIGGTILAAWMAGRSQIGALKLNIAAENNRAQKAEKRRIYAECLSTFSPVNRSLDKMRNFILSDNPSDKELKRAPAVIAEHESLVTALQSAISEVLLIASEDVAQLARRANEVILTDDGSQSANDKYHEIRDQLVRAMRADLGTD